MEKKSFIKNKYTLWLFILVVSILLADVFFHKGMMRVLLPESFTSKRTPATLTNCNRQLKTTGKIWRKGVNSIQQFNALPGDIAGFEMDVYFDTTKNYLEVYHDSAGYSNLKIEELLKLYQSKNLTAAIWLDFKNLTNANKQQSLNYILHIRENYNLQNKMIIESSSPQLLKSFCDSGFYTSYYIPFFNPYLLTENENIAMVDTIAANITSYPSTALSGYYFQYPFLKNFFPNYPLLTWAEDPALSLVSKIFNQQLMKDKQLKIVLYPF